MKRKILILSMALFSLHSFSQEIATEESGYVTNKFWDNWFLNVGGGASMYFGGKQDSGADFAERLTWGATVSAGKWFTPNFGARLTFQGGPKHTFVKEETAPFTYREMISNYYISGHADFLVNFSNLFAGYKEDRFYNLIPYAGAGAAVDFGNGNETKKSIVVAGGLLNNFRINDKMSVSLDLSGQLVQSKFNRALEEFKAIAKKNTSNDWDGIASVTLGLTYQLGKKNNFSRAGNLDRQSNQLQEELIEDLKEQVDGLQQENNRLLDQLNNVPNVVPAEPNNVQTIIKNVPTAVHFPINSYKINAYQEITLYNVAEFMKANPETKATIIGFADKETGDNKINENLSKKRAEEVMKRLINDYGIPSKRITYSWKGSDIQPYPVNNWNRVVIVTVEE